MVCRKLLCEFKFIWNVHTENFASRGCCNRTRICGIPISYEHNENKRIFFGILREQYIILIYKTIKLELYALKDIFKIVLVFIPKAYG